MGRILLRPHDLERPHQAQHGGDEQERREEGGHAAEEHQLPQAVVDQQLSGGEEGAGDGGRRGGFRFFWFGWENRGCGTARTFKFFLRPLLRSAFLAGH